MWDFLLNNPAATSALIAGTLTLLGTVFIQIMSSRLGSMKEDTERRKNALEAEDGFREDLMVQLGEANKRIDIKDQQIDQLKDKVLTLEDTNRRLEWELTLKTHQIEQQDQKIAQQNMRISEQSSRIADLEVTIKVIQEQIGNRVNL